MKRVMIPVIVCFLLLGCTPTTYKTDYHTGSEGIAPSFLESLPSNVYEDTLVPVSIRLSNNGAYSVNYSRIIFSLQSDEFYADVTQDPYLSKTKKTLWGKTLGYPTGDFVDVRPTVHFKSIQGLRESPTTELFASVCYPYESDLSTSICVDANAFNGNVQRQVCSAQTLTFQNQGGPVAVTSIENRPSPLRVAEAGGRGYLDIVQPTFIIHFKNVGGGAVLMPAPASDKERIAGCAMDIPPEKKSSIGITVQLSGINLSCDPDPVPLINGEGFTYCVLQPSEKVFIDAPNYLGTFRVLMTYLYKESTTADVEINRRPANSGEPTDAERQIIEGPSCEECTTNPEKCHWPDAARNVAKNNTFSCVCSEEECNDKFRAGKCVYGDSFCAGTNYCCVPG